MLRKAILQRCRANLETLRSRAADFPFSAVPEVGGGWSAVLRVPAVIDDEELCLRLLEDFGVAVHPGYLFQFPRDGHLVISLLPSRASFSEGTARLFEGLDSLVNSAPRESENPRIPNVLD
jgi:aspartate/methionine/tyrosine aminotransferase